MSMRSGIRHIFESTTARLPSRTGVGDRLVLAYHNVVEPELTGSGDASLHLGADSFWEQLQTLRVEANVVELHELLAVEPFNRDRLVAITFDDAYRSALSIALPMCSGAGVAATVFVSPSLLGKIPTWDEAATLGRWSESDRQRFLWSERGRQGGDSASDGPDHLRIGSEAELTEALRGTDHRLGNHTFSHPNLGAVDTATAIDEIERAAAWISTRFHAFSTPFLAYPFGIPPKEPAALVQVSGIEKGFAVSGGWMRAGISHDSFLLPRWNVPAGMSHDGFRCRLRGWFDGR